MSLEIKIAVTPSVLINAVMGRDKSIARPVALNLLFRSEIPNRATLLRNILDDEAEDSGLRHDAGLFLARLRTEESMDMLRHSAQKIQDSAALKAVIKGISRLGNEKDLEILEKIGKESTTDYLKQQASFGAALIAYRHGLHGHELRFPEKYLDMRDHHQLEITVKLPAAKIAKECLDALNQELIGIELSKGSLIQLDCFNRTSFIIQNMQLQEKSLWKSMPEKKMLYGIMASRISEHENYTGSAWIFTTPVRNHQLEILITRMTGEPLMAGTASVEDADIIRFEVNGVDETGNVAVNLGGSIKSGKMEITKAISGMKIIRKKKPLAVIKPPVPY